VYDGARVVLDSMLAVGDVIHTQAEENTVLKQVHDMLVQQQIGSGLGLGIVKSVVSYHKGTITGQSEPGKGTTFRIELKS
jgi:signal transduction histidine kinase